jgi:hypothetical protein
MPSTYMDLTNRLLRRVNDVEISQADFPSVRGIQAVAKDCILDTIREINSSRIDWPFNAVEHTQTLVVGVEEYAWPADFTAADWNSFQIQKSTSLNVNHIQLQPISREEWYHNYRDIDYDSGTAGKSVPSFVFPSHGQGWGLSPSPNKTYDIKFRYYKNPDDLSLYNDQTTIPSKFDYVIMAGALYHMNLFKENAEGVAIIKKKFEDGIQDMVNLYLPNPSYVYDSRVNFGGGQTGGGYLFYKGGL